MELYPTKSVYSKIVIYQEAKVILGIFILIIIMGFVTWKLPVWVISIYQNHVAEGIVNLGQKISSVENQQDAKKLIKLLKHINSLYFLSKRYKGTLASEQELQFVRDKTMLSIANVLEEYAGVNYGLNVRQWEWWLRRQSYSRIPCLE